MTDPDRKPDLLDLYLTRRPETDDDWRAKAEREGPSAWRSKANPITRRLAETITQDTLIPLNSPGGRNLWAIASQLMIDFHGDDVLIMRALEALRDRKQWRGIEPYQLRAMVQNEASRMRAEPGAEKYLKWTD